jgi:hypothetical protein
MRGKKVSSMQGEIFQEMFEANILRSIVKILVRVWLGKP